jgi:hypothetical protein
MLKGMKNRKKAGWRKRIVTKPFTPPEQKKEEQHELVQQEVKPDKDA